MWPTVDWDKHFDHDHHIPFILGLRPIYGAAESVTRIAKHYDAFYFTASSNNSQRARELWLLLHDFPKLPMVCTNGFDGKSEWLLDADNKIDVVIEDLPSVLKTAFQCDLLTLIYNTPWNSAVRDGKRVYSWNEVVSYLVPTKETRLPELPKPLPF